jgi:hypothetical protein
MGANMPYSMTDHPKKVSVNIKFEKVNSLEVPSIRSNERITQLLILMAVTREGIGASQIAGSVIDGDRSVSVRDDNKQ